MKNRRIASLLTIVALIVTIVAYPMLQAAADDTGYRIATAIVNDNTAQIYEEAKTASDSIPFDTSVLTDDSGKNVGFMDVYSIDTTELTKNYTPDGVHSMSYVGMAELAVGRSGGSDYDDGNDISDNVYAIVTIYYTYNSPIPPAGTYYLLTRVEGSYTFLSGGDENVHVQSQSVHYTCNGVRDNGSAVSNQYATKYPSVSSTSWSYQTGFTVPVLTIDGNIGAEYTINLKRGTSSTWQLILHAAAPG